MENKLRKFLSNVWVIHIQVFLGMFALFGYIMIDNKFLLLFIPLSFAGAICGTAMRVIDAIKESKQ